MANPPNNYVSTGRNPVSELTCGFPQCGHWKRGNGAGGWCQHPSNRVPPSEGWPNGFTPSTMMTGGCDLHSSGAPGAVRIAGGWGELRAPSGVQEGGNAPAA